MPRIEKYLDRLAAKEPVPGGGSAAALAGATGMALLSMVGRYAMVRHKGKKASALLKDIVASADRSRRRLLILMEKDEAAFLKLWSAVKKREFRGLEPLYKNAASVPRETCSILGNGLAWCAKLGKYCGPSLRSDLAEAAILMEAAFAAAELNVDINIKAVKGAGYVKKIRRTLLREKRRTLNLKKAVLRSARL